MSAAPPPPRRRVSARLPSLGHAPSSPSVRAAAPGCGHGMVLEMSLLLVAPRNGGLALLLFCLANRVLADWRRRWRAVRTNRWPTIHLRRESATTSGRT